MNGPSGSTTNSATAPAASALRCFSLNVNSPRATTAAAPSASTEAKSAAVPTPGTTTIRPEVNTSGLPSISSTGSETLIVAAPPRWETISIMWPAGTATNSNGSTAAS